MNTHIPLQPAIPRRQHEMNYVHPQSHPPQYYQGYQHPYPPQPFPQQWYPPPYQHMGMPVPRPYQHYPPMVNNAPYPIPHRNPTPLQHRPQMPQHSPSTRSIHSHQGVVSPAPSNTSLNVPAPIHNQVSHPQISTPPPPPASIHRMPFYPPVSLACPSCLGITC